MVVPVVVAIVVVAIVMVVAVVVVVICPVEHSCGVNIPVCRRQKHLINK